LIRCPNCGIDHYYNKDKHSKEFTNIKGDKEKATMYRYECPECGCTYSVCDKDVLLYERTERSLVSLSMKNLMKSQSLQEIEFDIIGKFKVARTTILRWMKKAVDTMPEWTEVFQPRTSGTVAIDEKWVKLRKEWYYVFIAIDEACLDIIHIEVYAKRNTVSARSFLAEIKAMGYPIEVIITDGCPIYGKAIPKVYPEAKHIKCVLHMSRSRRNLLMKEFGSYNHPDYKELSPYISKIYAARTKKQFKQAWSKWLKIKKKYPEINDFAQALEADKEAIKKRVLDKEHPRTSNSVERVIKAFENKYYKMENFMSLPYARA
jgi:putative transposase